MAAVYRYCRIHLDGIGMDFYYRTENEALQAGDFVAVPFGRENRERIGQLVSVTLCTAADAPYPPEKTKEILRRTERPAHWGEPKPPKKVVRQPEAPSDAPSPAPPSTPRQPETVPILPATQKPDRSAAAATERRRLPGRKRIPARRIGVVAAVLLCAVGVLWLQRLYSSRYAQAETAFAAGAYTQAQTLAQQVPGWFRGNRALRQLVAAAQTATRSADPDELAAALETLRSAAPEDGSVAAAAKTLEQQATLRWQQVIYAQALEDLTRQRYESAAEALQKITGYGDAAALRCYAQAMTLAETAELSQLQQAAAVLAQIPETYAGDQAAEVAALRLQLPKQIAAARAAIEQAQREERERIARLEATGLPYVGLSEERVQSTRQLGKAWYSFTRKTQERAASGGYVSHERRIYKWFQEGGGAVFTAVCENGTVVEAYPTSPKCWSGERLLVTLGKPKSTFGSGEKTSHSIRDDYDNPEDLYEDNRDWYDDEDEAYEEWEND